MRSALQISRGLSFVAAVFFTVIVPNIASGAGYSPPLKGHDIKDLIAGAKVHLHTPLGGVIPVLYREDGFLSGQAGMVSFFLGSSRDQGRWWVSGSKLCQKWKIWFKGKENCLVIRRSGMRFKWDDGKGETGVATIIVPSVVTAARLRSSKKTKSTRRSSARSGQRAIGLGGPSRSPAKTKTARKIAKAQPKPNPASIAAARSRASAASAAQPKNSVATSQAHARAASAPVAPVRGTTNRNASKQGQTQPTFRVVGVPYDDVLNVRRNPSPEAAIVGTIPPRSRDVRIVGACEDYWCPVSHARSRGLKRGRGWVSREFLAEDSSRNGNRSASRRRKTFRVVNVVAGDVLNIRREPSEDSQVMGTISPNAGGIRSAGYCHGDWCPISHARSRGWVNRYYITPVTRSSSRFQ